MLVGGVIKFKLRIHFIHTILINKIRIETPTQASIFKNRH